MPCLPHEHLHGGYWTLSVGVTASTRGRDNDNRGLASPMDRGDTAYKHCLESSNPVGSRSTYAIHHPQNLDMADNKRTEKSLGRGYKR